MVFRIGSKQNATFHSSIRNDSVFKGTGGPLYSRGSMVTTPLVIRKGMGSNPIQVTKEFSLIESGYCPFKLRE